RLQRRDAHLAARRVHHPVPGEDLLAQGHRAPRRGGRREYDLPLQPGDVEVEQAAVLDDAPRDLTLARGERAERDRLSAAYRVEQGEVAGGEHAQVLAVLLVDAVDVFRDHELDPRAHLRVGGLLAGGALAAPLAAHRGDEPAAFHGAAGDRKLVAALEPQIGEIAQRLVVVVADVGRGDFIGGDVVAQGDSRTPGEVLPL